MKKLLLMIAAVTALSSLSPFGNVAMATSPYDDAYNLTSDLTLYNQSCGGTRQNYSLDRDGLINFLVNDPQYGSSFKNALLYGRYGISNYTKASEYAPGQYENNIAVFWSEDNSLSMNWTTFSSNQHIIYPSGSITTVLIYAYGYSCSLDAYNPGTVAISSNTAGGSVKNYYIRTDYPNYPSEYEGTKVPFDPSSGRIQGTAECISEGDGIISNVLVEADSGMDGEAKISNYSSTAKEYIYYLTEASDYSIKVMCDGEPYFGPTVDVNHSYYYNWLCTKIDTQNVCATS